MVKKLRLLKTSASPVGTIPESMPLQGVSAGFIELLTDDECRVRLTSGEALYACVAPDVDRELLLDCLHGKRVVLLAPGRPLAMILGALQTRRAIDLDADGDLVVRARRIRLEVREEFDVQTLGEGAGKCGVRVRDDGQVRICGERLEMSALASVRVHSASVELP